MCHWCKKEIKGERVPYVTNTQVLDNGHRLNRYYHAKACYEAWRYFAVLQEFVGLLKDE